MSCWKHKLAQWRAVTDFTTSGFLMQRRHFHLFPRHVSAPPLCSRATSCLLRRCAAHVQSCLAESIINPFACKFIGGCSQGDIRGVQIVRFGIAVAAVMYQHYICDVDKAGFPAELSPPPPPLTRLHAVAHGYIDFHYIDHPCVRMH